jgi:competence protein ComEC
MKPLRLPLLPVLFAYTTGLIAGSLAPPSLIPGEGLLYGLLGLLGVWALFILLKKLLPGTLAGLVFFFLFGLHSIQVFLLPPTSPHSILRFAGIERVAVEGIVDHIPLRSPERTRLVVDTRRVIAGDRAFTAQGRLLLLLRRDSRPFRLGDHLRVLCRISPPAGFHNPGGFSYERRLAFDRIEAIAFPVIEDGWVKLGGGFGNPILLRVEAWRDRIREFLQREADPRCVGIFEALVLGEQGNIPEETREHFTAAGIAHLLAISGDQFGIVAFLCYALLLWGLKRSEILLLSVPVYKWAAGLTIPCLLLYGLISGAGISVIRAMIMAVLFFVSILVDRERNLLHTLAVAAFLILLVTPASLFDVSFQLSFAAVLSILYLLPPLTGFTPLKEIPLLPEPLWRRIVRKILWPSLLVTFVATLGTAPLVAYHFNRLSPLGLVTNLVVIPWVGFLIVPLALAASLLSFFLPPVAVFLVQVNNALTLSLLGLIGWAAGLPGATVYVSTPTMLELGLFGLLLLLSIHLRRSRPAQIGFAVALLALTADGVWWNLRDRFQKDLRVTFLDVGQGDAIFVEFPGGQKMLVDGGGLPDDRFDVGRQVIAPFLWHRKIRRIDTLVLTHPDPDHLNGLPFIASHFRIGRFWESGLRSDSEAFRKLEAVLAEKEVSRTILKEGSPIEKIGPVEITFLNPPSRERPRKGRRGHLLNNASLAMILK